MTQVYSKSILSISNRKGRKDQMKEFMGTVSRLKPNARVLHQK